MITLRCVLRVVEMLVEVKRKTHFENYCRTIGHHHNKPHTKYKYLHNAQLKPVSSRINNGTFNKIKDFTL